MPGNAERLRELYATARRRPPEARALIDPDATWEGVDAERWKPCENGDEVLRTLVWRVNALRMRPRSVLDAGDRVVVTLVGTHLRRVGGRGFLFQQLFQVVTFRNGRVLRIKDYARREEALAAVGLRA